MTTIAISSHKGGSTKTTTAIHLGAGLAELGHSVLLVDMDPQGHLAEGLGMPDMEIQRDISEVLDNKASLSSIIQNVGQNTGVEDLPPDSVRSRINLAGANINLAFLEPLLFTRHRREDQLKYALEEVENNYDFIIIDCPPSLGLLTVNALTASDYVIVPMVVEYYSMLGVGRLLQTIKEMKRQLNPKLEIVGLLPTRYTRTNNAKEVLDRTKQDLEGVIHVYDCVVPETVKFREAAAGGLTIYEHDSHNAGATAYRLFTEQVISYVKQEQEHVRSARR